MNIKKNMLHEMKYIIYKIKYTIKPNCWHSIIKSIKYFFNILFAFSLVYLVRDEILLGVDAINEIFTSINCWFYPAIGKTWTLNLKSLYIQIKQ